MEQLVDRQIHNLEVTGSNPVVATKERIMKKEPKCANYKTCKHDEGDVWSFKTERMKRKIHLCWDCLQKIKQQITINT